MLITTSSYYIHYLKPLLWLSVKKSTGETTSGVLCSVLCSPLQERHGHTGMNPEKGHKDRSGTGASVMWGEAVRAGTFSARAVTASSQWVGGQTKMPGGLHGWTRSSQQNWNTKEEACRWWKQGEATWEEYRDSGWACRDAFRKAKAYL